MLLAAGAGARNGVYGRLFAGENLESATSTYHRFRSDRYLLAPDMSGHIGEFALFIAYPGGGEW
jgi:hypothetical protein